MLSDHFERAFWDAGLTVAGVDEVGRGPLAGPVMAAAVVFSGPVTIAGLDDSKKLTAQARARLYPQIVAQARAIGLGAVGPRTIDRINIAQASKLAMQRALDNLSIRPQVVLADAVWLEDGAWYCVSLVHGDARAVSIAAASVVAKVIRDQYMRELAEAYPEYGFELHKGYPTPLHYRKLEEWGPCPAHRQSFLKRWTPTVQSR